MRDHHPNEERHVTARRSPFVTAVIGSMTVAILVLIGFVFFSDFPGEPQGSASKGAAPPEDVRR